jgi:hypothetical protein
MWIIGAATIRVTADNTSINAGICRRPSLTISIGLSLFSIRYHEQRILGPGGYCDLCPSPDKSCRNVGRVPTSGRAPPWSCRFLTTVGGIVDM